MRVRIIKRLGNILLAGSLLFFLETAFEMYVLTMLRGPQMIGFSIAHVKQILLVLVLVSALCYLCLLAFAAVVSTIYLAGRTGVSIGYGRFMIGVFLIQVVHLSLLLSYDSWSSRFFSPVR